MKTQRNRFRNKTSFGASLKKMDDHTYALRRKVMDVLYEAKRRGFNLPRVEVRIVQNAEGVCAYAWIGQNVVHVDEKYTAEKYSWFLTRLVLHELGHAVLGLRKIEGCRLMDCDMKWNKTFNEAEAWELFEGYYNKWKK